jgi:hypothetical protein
MAIQPLRADASHIDKIAPLFDAYRGFYGQPSNLPQSRDFIAERIARDESVIFYVEDTDGEALGFVQMFPTFPPSTHTVPGCSATCSPRPPPGAKGLARC